MLNNVYFPMQNLLKICESTSSDTSSPLISPSDIVTSLRSIVQKSMGKSCSTDVRSLSNALLAFNNCSACLYTRNTPIVDYLHDIIMKKATIATISKQFLTCVTNYQVPKIRQLKLYSPFTYMQYPSFLYQLIVRKSRIIGH